MKRENEIIIFETADKSITLPVSVKSDTVWLSANQMAELFERDEKTIRKHINNVFSEEEVEFRRWANSVLKEYIIKGYSVNYNRMNQLNEVIRIMKRVGEKLDTK